MAEQYPDKGKKATPAATTPAVTTQQTGRENGAREYSAPERKGFPWWVLLLGLIPLLFFLFRGRDNQQEQRQPAPVAAASPAPVPTAPASPTTDAVAPVAADTSTAESAAQPPAPAANEKVYQGRDIAVGATGAASAQGAPLTDVVSFANAADPSALIGRKAKLTDATVGRVVNDRAFYVTSGDGRQMLVLLDPGMNAGAGAAGAAQKVALQEGGRVSLTGVVKALPEQAALQQYGMTAEDMAGLQQQGAYLHATVAQSK